MFFVHTHGDVGHSPSTVVMRILLKRQNTSESFKRAKKWQSFMQSPLEMMKRAQVARVIMPMEGRMAIARWQGDWGSRNGKEIVQDRLRLLHPLDWRR